MFYVVFFKEDNKIVTAHKAPEYPKVSEIVYLLKLLEKSDLEDIEDLMMDILTEEEFKGIDNGKDIK